MRIIQNTSENYLNNQRKRATHIGDDKAGCVSVCVCVKENREEERDEEKGEFVHLSVCLCVRNRSAILSSFSLTLPSFFFILSSLSPSPGPRVKHSFD